MPLTSTFLILPFWNSNFTKRVQIRNISFTTRMQSSGSVILPVGNLISTLQMLKCLYGDINESLLGQINSVSEDFLINHKDTYLCILPVSPQINSCRSIPKKYKLNMFLTLHWLKYSIYIPLGLAGENHHLSRTAASTTMAALPVLPPRPHGTENSYSFLGRST
jgi:hypothetical protein